ncbi:MAG TPA: class I adenylate-forming enzyme family protein [Pantanalinema sp.]
MSREDSVEIPTLSDLIRVQATLKPHVEALVADGRRWTYSALDRGIRRIAGALLAGHPDLAPGERVLLMAPTSDSFVIGYFALLHLGAVPVPLSPRLHEVELLAHARDCQARLLLADASAGDVVRETFIRAFGGRVMRLDPRRQQVSWQAASGEDPFVPYFDLPYEATPAAFAVEPDAIATILYSSGTTGEPRGIALSHRALLAGARAVTDALPPASAPSTAIVLPLHHAYPLVAQLLSTLLVGGFVQLFRGLAFPFPVLQEMQREAVSSFAGVPATFRALAALDDLAELDLGEVKHVLCGGAPLAPDDEEAIRKVFPGARVFDVYGQTEAGPVALIAQGEPGFATGRFARPFPGVCLRIVGDDGPLEQGEVGTVEVQSPFLMRGYWQGPAEAREGAPGWHATGDLGFLDAEGALHLIGRHEEVIVSGSEKVSPREVESVLLRHPGIKEAAVLGVTDRAHGQRIVAWVVAAASDIDPAAAQRHCEQYLAHHKCPREVRLLDTLPRTASGKVHRALLHEWSQG